VPVVLGGKALAADVPQDARSRACWTPSPLKTSASACKHAIGTRRALTFTPESVGLLVSSTSSYDPIALQHMHAPHRATIFIGFF